MIASSLLTPQAAKKGSSVPWLWLGVLAVGVAVLYANEQQKQKANLGAN